MPPQIFDRALLKQRRARAARRNPFPFLMERCVEDCVEKIRDINRRFNRALIIAPAATANAIIDALPEEKRPETIKTGFFTDNPAGLDIILDEESLPFVQPEFDLILSILSLHTVNDLPGALVQFQQALLPDGVFIGAMFGGETLGGLRKAAYNADAELLGGMSPRVFPFADFQQLAGLLQRTGFALPVVDTDRVTVTYRDIDRLIADLRDMGETNILVQRDQNRLSRNYKDSLAQALLSNPEAPTFQVIFEILWLTGWSPHESQQKPLKPGSAQVSLTEVLADKSKS